MTKLQNKIALITGGTTGIGLATAKLFLEVGAQVVVTGRNPVTLDQAEKELAGRAQVVRSDAASLEDIDALLAGIRDRYGRLDVLFINAGVGQFRPIEEVDEELFDRLMNVNLKGPYFTVQRALPLLSDGSSVIFNSTVGALKGVATTSVYAASKAGLTSLSRSLGAELAPRGIRVNTISPGPVDTPVYGKLELPPEAVEAVKDTFRQSVALKRFGRPDELARVALFLACEDSSFITGQNLVVDGGYLTLSA
ncbi:SDR family oxidoreductase [Haliangium sp.]|uniref:SDR family oxidoreductase n=1 Tax=Haliangium sp. TaxID=2663208 RepID=UPI003D118CA2